MTCIALLRESVLIAACELAWGYIDECQPGRQPRQRDDITHRLGDAITDFAASVRGSRTDIGQVCVCGGLPELRSMTAPLMERVDIEVEPLDSLFGIDAARLPEPVEEFRERGAELRLAWAVAADWPSPINLLRFRKRQASKTVLARAAVATGMAAGWAARVATPPAVAASKLVAPPPAVVAVKPPVAAPSAVIASKPPVAAPPAVIASMKPAPEVASAVASRPPLAAPTPPAAPVVQSGATRQFEAQARAQAAAVRPSPALMNTAPGVRGARVVEITPNAVMLRDGRGRLWRLDLGVGVR